MEKIDFKDNISETLLINLYMRSLDYKDTDQILGDCFSQSVVEKIDYNFSKFNSGKMSKTGILIRAKFFDDVAVEFCEKYQNTVIVQVGAGLDTRPLRLAKICKNTIFYDIDLPDVIQLRKKLMPKNDNNFYIGQSMFETDWMDDLAKKHHGAKFCFILEGVAIYFNETLISGFFRNLADRFEGIIALDLLNNFMANQMNKGGHDTLKFIRSKLKFYGIDGEKDVLKWSDKISHVKTAQMLKMYKKHWGFLGMILRAIPVCLNSNRMFVFKIG